KPMVSRAFAVAEFGWLFPPHTKHTLCVVVSLAVPVGRVPINRIGSKRPPKGGMPIGRSISRIDGAVAGAVPHQDVRKCIGSAMFEAAAYLLDVVHAEKDIERAVDVRIEFCGAIDRLVAQRKVGRHQAAIVPPPRLYLLAHLPP